jgi:hypothetical protein
MVEEATALGLRKDDESCGILAAIQNFAFYGGLWYEDYNIFTRSMPGSAGKFGGKIWGFANAKGKKSMKI